MSDSTGSDAWRRTLRADIRAQRRALSEDARKAATAAMLRLLRVLPSYRAARRIGTFLAFEGEPDLGSLITRDLAKEFFVPLIRGNEMVFARMTPTTPCAANSFGILEPLEPVLIDPRSLDVVLTPLVAFDERGVRIGVGRGYYDRCFAFLRGRDVWHRPKLVGVAYSFQRVAEIEARDWDVPLWAAVTEKGARIFR